MYVKLFICFSCYINRFQFKYYFDIVLNNTILKLLDFDSQDLGGSSVLDSDYLTMLSSSDKLMSGEFEALERLQAELDLFDDPNRPEEIVEQLADENHLDLIEEVCSDNGDAMIREVTANIKEEIIDSDDELESPIHSHKTIALVQPKIEEEVVTIKQSQCEVVSVTGSTATKRSAPPSSPGNQQTKKSV